MHQDNELFASLSRGVTAVCAEQRVGDHVMGKSSDPTTGPQAAERHPPLNTQLLYSLHTSVKHRYPLVKRERV